MAPFRERPRRPRPSYGPMILSALVLLGLIVVGKLATSRFAWWRDTSFEGQVTAKEARSRDTGQPVGESAGAGLPGNCQFFLRIRDQDGEALYEVVPKLFQVAHVGEIVVKRRGSYRWECRRGAGAPEQEGAEAE